MENATATYQFKFTAQLGQGACSAFDTEAARELDYADRIDVAVARAVAIAVAIAVARVGNPSVSKQQQHQQQQQILIQNSLKRRVQVYKNLPIE
jgi:hypothetical protein